MANENLIAYQNQVKLQNTTSIGTLNQTIVTIGEQIEQANLNITNYNSQKTQCEAAISTLQNDNVLIDETIAILEQP